MATINNTIRLNDNMRPVLQGIILTLDNTLRTMGMLNVASDNSFLGMKRDIEGANSSLILLLNTLNRVDAGLGNTARGSKTASFSFAELASKVWLIKNAFDSLQGTFNFIDDMTNMNNRLNLIVEDANKLVDVNDKIYQSANRARASYLGMASQVGKLGILASEAFKDTDEIIKFSELMEKVFKLSGASQQEQHAASYQLAQAMASGRLQGDEFRSIIENAPMLANYIVKYTGVAKSKLRDLSRDGVISSDIIKNSLFSGAKEIEERFSTMSITIAQRFQVMQNVATKNIQPVINKVTELMNSAEFNNLYNKALVGIIKMTMAMMRLFEISMNVSNYIIEQWARIGPIFDALVGGLKIYMLYLGWVKVLSIGTAYATATAWAAANAPLLVLIGIGAMVYSLWDRLNGLGKVLIVMLGGVTLALGAATYAQIGFNTAIASNPIGLILTAITLVILGIIKLINYLIDLYNTNQEFAYGFIEAWEYLKAGFLTIMTPILEAMTYMHNMYIRIRNDMKGRATEEIELWKVKNPWTEAEKNIKMKKEAWKPIMPNKEEIGNDLTKTIKYQVDALDKSLLEGKKKLRKGGKDSIDDIYEYNKNMAIKNITNMGNNVRINIAKIEKSVDADNIIDKLSKKLMSSLDNAF